MLNGCVLVLAIVFWAIYAFIGFCSLSRIALSGRWLVKKVLIRYKLFHDVVILVCRRGT